VHPVGGVNEEMLNKGFALELLIVSILLPVFVFNANVTKSLLHFWRTIEGSPEGIDISVAT
jgi:hypothetical protein